MTAAAPSASNGPDFIGVGPEKTGTSWIDAQLRAHPDVWIPPLKELRYFWEKKHFPGEPVRKRFDSDSSWHHVQYAAYARQRMRALVKHPLRSVSDPGRLAWDARYLFGRHDDDWYRRCFAPSGERLGGEVSPQYFFLTPDEIDDIAHVAPKARIIVSLREPVDWVWSFARMIVRDGRIDEVYGDLEEFVDGRIERCLFSQTLADWRRAFGSDRVLVLFFDRLKDDPWSWYESICDFLGIVPDTQRKEALQRRVNVGADRPAPDWLVDRVRDGYRADVAGLDEMVPDLPAGWRRGM